MIASCQPSVVRHSKVSLFAFLFLAVVSEALPLSSRRGLHVPSFSQESYRSNDTAPVADTSGARSSLDAFVSDAIAITGFVTGRGGVLYQKDTKNGTATNSSDDGPQGNNLLGINMSKMKIGELYLLLWGMLFVAIVGALIFEIYHYRCAGADLSQEISYGDEEHQNRLTMIFSGIWPLVRPYFFQPKNWCPWYYVLAMVVLGLWNMVLHLLFTLWTKEFWDILENKKIDEFMPIMRDFTILVTTLILVGTYQAYVGMMLVIDWRKWMTSWLLGRWLESKTYYRLQVSPSTTYPDNPDQRLQEDISVFIQQVVALSAGFFEAVGQLVSMLPVLLFLSPTQAFGMVYLPGWLLYIAILYSGCGTVAAHYIGSKLILINFAKERYEADFRYHVVQVRDHAESIALYGAEDCEQQRLEGRFDRIVKVWWELMMYTKRLGFFTAFYGQTSVTFPYLVLAPNYFKGQITLGSMFMLFRALGQVKGAFDWIIASYGTLTSFRATADRLNNFMAAIDLKTSSQVQHLYDMPPKHEGAVLVAKDLCVRLPENAGNRVVWQAANLVAKEGEFILLTAPEGSGKSCFFRALSGIWPYASGTVHVSGSVLFVPQKSHIPQGSLKQALTYPESQDQFCDSEVTAALQAVGLEKVIGSRTLSEEANWEMVFSGGEQQRLAIAHAVLRKPKVLFLDEATSAMGEDGALELFSLLRRPGTLPDGAAVITISHDIGLLTPVHDTRYVYDQEQGQWTSG